MRDAIRDEACGFIHLSKNITLEYLNLHFLGNFGIVGQYSENLTYKYLNCEPEYGSRPEESWHSCFSMGMNL